MARKGIRTRIVSDDAYALTRSMNRVGKLARPVFREAGQQVADVAAKDLRRAAEGFSVQTASLASSIDARRDRVPYVSVRAAGIYRMRSKRKRDAVRSGDIAFGSEYGRRRGNFVAPRHGSAPQQWKPAGHWWGPTIRRNAPEWEEIWLDALDRILEAATR